MSGDLEARFDAALREARLEPDDVDRAAALEVAAFLDRARERLREAVADDPADGSR